jgi:hypothetical protein
MNNDYLYLTKRQFTKINIEFPTKKEDSIVDIYFGDIAGTFSHRIQNKGYDLIKVTRRLNSLKQDTLSSRIIDFYLKMNHHFQEMQQHL